jgi:cytochrome P450
MQTASDNPIEAAAPPPPASGNGVVELLRFGADPLAYLTRLGHRHELGLVPLRLGTVRGFLVTDPEGIHAVLERDDPALLGRGRFLATERWYGGGLFFVGGAEYDRQANDLGRPIWTDPRTPEIARRHAERLCGRWRAGEPFEAFGAFRELFFAVDWEQLTGRDDDPKAVRLLVDGNRWLPKLLQPFGTLVWRLPNPGRRSRERLDEILDGIIAECRAAPPDEAPTSAVAAMVQQAAADGVTSDADIRSTVRMQYADPLHVWLLWTFYALARNPAVEDAFHEELDRVLGGRPASGDDVGRLPVLRRILMESARLYPPVHGIFREVTADVCVLDAVVPKGHTLVLCQWVTHRDARLWDDPLRFDPERWADGAPKPRPYAYFPFSGGRLGCHGRDQAVKEAVVVTTTIGQRWKLRPVSDREPKPLPGWALEPKGGLRMVPEAR